MKKIESFSVMMAKDIVSGLIFLHSRGIAHRDLKPANILVTNQHYANIEDGKERQKVLEAEPIICKLTDFGESRSALLQTKTLLQTNTIHVQKGTMGFMAPEQFQGAFRINQANPSQLMKIDIWQLGMTLFCLMNPNLRSPYQLQFSKDANLDTNIGEFLGQLLNKGVLPEMCLEYHIHRQIYWPQILSAYEKCARSLPDHRASLDSVRRALEVDCLNTATYLPLSISQATALEEYDKRVSSGKPAQYPQNDGTGCCTFLCLKIAESLMQLKPGSFEEIAGTNLALHFAVTLA